MCHRTSRSTDFMAIILGLFPDCPASEYCSKVQHALGAHRRSYTKGQSHWAAMSHELISCDIHERSPKYWDKNHWKWLEIRLSYKYNMILHEPCMSLLHYHKMLLQHRMKIAQISWEILSMLHNITRASCDMWWNARLQDAPLGNIKARWPGGAQPLPL